MSQAAPASVPWPAMSVQQAYALITQPGTPGRDGGGRDPGREDPDLEERPADPARHLLFGRAHGEKIFLVHEDERVSFEAFYRADPHGRRAGRQGRQEGRPGRHRHAQPARMAGGLLWRAVAGRDRHAAERLVDGRGAGIRPGRFRGRVAIVDVERYERLAEHFDNCPDLERVYVSRSKEEIAHPYVKRLETVIGCPNDWAKLEEKPLPTVAIGPDDDATIFYTSGTTGKPKGAIGTHRNVNSNIFAAAAAGARSFLRRGEAPPSPIPACPQRARCCRCRSSTPPAVSR
jgi:long-chain acyl-CoA synthetase